MTSAVSTMESEPGKFILIYPKLKEALSLRRNKSPVTEIKNLNFLSEMAHQQLILYQSLGQRRAMQTLCLLTSVGKTQGTKTELPKVDNALSYLDQVKNAFEDKPDAYHEFLEIMKDFKSQSLDTLGMISSISVLFKEHPELIDGFNTFLPQDHKIQIKPQEQQVQSEESPEIKMITHKATDAKLETSKELKQTLSFLNKVKKKVQNETYTKFIEIILSLKSGNLTETQARQQIENLFEGHKELLEDLGHFLPNQPSAETGETPTTPLKRPGPETEVPGPSKKPKLALSHDPSIAGIGKFGGFEELSFFDDVRRLVDRFPEIYENFMRCFYLFNEGLIDKNELLGLVTPFLSKQPSLMKRFKDIVGLGVPEARDVLVSRPRRTERDEMDVDYSTCKNLGVSYYSLPRNHVPAACSGRTQLCREVLNDTWVSFPSWSSEDSGSVSFRRTQSEEYMHRVEDERYELDVVLETHISTIRVLDEMLKKLGKMNPVDASRFRLDDTLGGSSPTMHLKAIRRIYGDKAPEIIEGLKRNPVIAIPVVLRRMRAKEEEWREARKNFEKTWKEETDKHFLKSLDHISPSFKQNDVKNLRSRALVNEIEELGGQTMKLACRNVVLNDALELLMYCTKRQNGITKEDRRKIQVLLSRDVPDFFRQPHIEVKNEEKEEEEGEEKDKETNTLDKEAMDREDHVVFLGNGHWYTFVRLYQLLCERLYKVAELANQVKEEEELIVTRKNATPTASSRANRKKVDVEVEKYYSHFLSLVKNLLDGNLEPVAYEDSLREMFGVNAYFAYTMDRVVNSAVRQLGQLVTNEPSIKCIEIFHKHWNSKNTLNEETSYERQIVKLLEDEHVYKISYWRNLGDESYVDVDILNPDWLSEISDSPIDEQFQEMQNWSCYIDSFVSDEDRTCDLMSSSKKPLYLSRNLKLNRDDNNLIIDENSQCIFKQGSFQMNFVLNSGSFLHRRGSLRKPAQFWKRLYLHRSRKFHGWYSKWAEQNVTKEQETSCNDWFLGKGENLDLKSNLKTFVQKMSIINRAPYRPVLKYRVAVENC